MELIAYHLTGTFLVGAHRTAICCLPRGYRPDEQLESGLSYSDEEDDDRDGAGMAKAKLLNGLARLLSGRRS